MERNSEEKLKDNKLEKILLYIIFAIYILCLVKIILFKNYSMINVLNGSTQNGYRSANLILFQTIADFKQIGIDSFMWAFSNIIGNICVFMPLGYLVPMLFNKMNNFYKVVLMSFLLSTIFEVLQYTYYLGTLDVDDLMLNTIGGISGYGVYLVITNLMNNKLKIYRISILLSVIAFIGAFTIAKDEFGNLLGITEHETIYVGDEEIPKTECDIRGTYLDSNEVSLKMYNSVTSENSLENDYLSQSDVSINEQTKIYYIHYEEDKNKTTIKYEELEKSDISKIEKYSLISVWTKENEAASTIVFSDKMVSTEGTTMTGVSGNNERKDDTLSGFIEEINEDDVVINIITTQKLEDGGTISTSSNGEYRNLVNIKFKDNTTFMLNLIKHGGEDVTTTNSSKKDLKIGDIIDLKGKKEGDIFIAQDVIINKIVE